MEKVLKVTEIQRFCMHDGPGLRTTVFLKGCPLRCAWCHNPETQKSGGEVLFYPQKCIGCGECVRVCPTHAHTLSAAHVLDRAACRACFACTDACPTGALAACGEEMPISRIIDTVMRDIAFYGERGGVTLSGGEPFAQGPAAVALLRACKEKGLSTAVETCGYAALDVLLAALPFTDLFLWDVKDTDTAGHTRYTGVSNEKILQNLRAVDAAGGKTRLRCILVNGVNTARAHYENVAALACELAHCEGVEFLPYHAYAGSKATFLGGTDNGRAEWIPTAAQSAEARAVLQAAGVTVFDPA